MNCGPSRHRAVLPPEFVVEIEPADAPRFVQSFERDCHVDAEAVRSAVARRDMFNILRNTWITKADLIVRKEEPYRRQEFARRRAVALGGTRVWIVAPEDLLLSKLV